MKKICPSCGKTEEENEFITSFCPACYSSRHELYRLPHTMEITVCPSCGNTASGEPLGSSEKQLAKHVIAKFRSEHELKSYVAKVDKSGKNREVLLELLLIVHGKEVTKHANVTVRVTKKQCTKCSRRSSGYFEAIIQLRAEEGNAKSKIEKLASTAAKLIEEKSFVPRVEKTVNGIDVYSGSASEAQKALHALKLHYAISKKQSGMKQGKRLYRTTFCAHV
ncbi:TPA: hypothetical protein HA318_01225 [Candidatus Micrarchaeota archaeon]|nr:hypothetical protein [Candidatus Micrarchaeota archaeon]